MEEEIRSNINVNITIPPQKLMGAAMDVINQYKPIVEEAVKETREQLLFDNAFQEQVKEEIINEVRKIIQSKLRDIACRMVDDVLYEQKEYIEGKIKKHLKKEIEYLY